MTVLAWDGKTLAADRLMSHGQTKQSCTKIFRWEDSLLGVCGDLSTGMEMLYWFQHGAIPADFPPANRSLTDGASLIVVDAGGVRKYESSPHPFIVEGGFCAFGSGDECALVAMACGRDAIKAVEMAISFNATCGNGVDSLTLCQP